MSLVRLGARADDVDRLVQVEVRVSHAPGRLVTFLPPAFDLSMGHQLQTGQAVPLAGFPEGDYRLEIKVTDKLANKSVTRDVNFTVTAS